MMMESLYRLCILRTLHAVKGFGYRKLAVVEGVAPAGIHIDGGEVIRIGTFHIYLLNERQIKRGVGTAQIQGYGVYHCNLSSVC